MILKVIRLIILIHLNKFKVSMSILTINQHLRFKFDSWIDYGKQNRLRYPVTELKVNQRWLKLSLSWFFNISIEVVTSALHVVTSRQTDVTSRYLPFLFPIIIVIISLWYFFIIQRKIPFLVVAETLKKKI